tara:strand:+ start:576 stop:956 length:381 start_codon:yes stop_codon:yes gene_type:complete
MSTLKEECDNVGDPVSCEIRNTPIWSKEGVQVYEVNTTNCNRLYDSTLKDVEKVTENFNVSTLVPTLIIQGKRRKMKKKCKKTPGLSKSKTRFREMARRNKWVDRTYQFTNIGTERDNPMVVIAVE